METILFFDSKSPFVNGTSQHMSTEFRPPLELDLNKQYEVALVNANIWYSWFNITAENNKFKFYDGSKWTIVSIPHGAYNITDINKYIKKHLSTEDAINIEPNFNTLHSDLTLADGYQVDFTIENTIAPILGFSKKLIRASTTSDFLVKITEVESIIIHCSLVTSAYINGRSGDVIYSFNPDKPPGYLLSIQPNEKTFLPVSRRDMLSRIDIRITDQENREIDLNDERSTITLHFRERK